MTSCDNESKVDVKGESFFLDVSTGLGSRMRERIAHHDEIRRQGNGVLRCNDSENMSLQEREQYPKMVEERRVSEIIEGILYEFLPAAFNSIIPPCADPRTELTYERCKLVASAALCVSALLNCPQPLLEFLIKIPWQSIEELLKKTDDNEWIAEQLEISEETRNELINTPIDSKLIPSIVEFLYSETYQLSVPLQLRVSSELNRPVHLERVSALLDGACPLHCAALRGNPLQVGYFLSCGANPLKKTVIGDLPIVLVPFCGDRTCQTSKKICRCLCSREQETLECRSSNARTLIARKCILSVGNGLFAWIIMVFLCILSWLGFWGCHADVCNRLHVSKHAEYVKKDKADKARFERKELLSKIRKEVRKGHELLALAKQNPLPKKITNREDNIAENAFICFVHAVQYLQSLETCDEARQQSRHLAPYPVYPQTTAPHHAIQYPESQLSEDEKADVYCAWAESVLFKFKFCKCAGCAAIAVQSMRMAHLQCAQLLEMVRNRSEEFPTRLKSVGKDLMKIVYFHICLIVETEAKKGSLKESRNATKASLWRAEHCLKEWRNLKTQNYLMSTETCEEKEIEDLDKWVKTAESDLLLAEALYGDELTPSQTVKEVLEVTVARSPVGVPYLSRPSALNNIQTIEEALESVKSPSSDLAALTKQVMENGNKEITAASKLREMLSSKTTLAVLGTIEKLSEAIVDASVFPRLDEEVANARKLQQQFRERAEAIEKLEVLMLHVKEPIPLSKTKDASMESSILLQRIKSLQEGIDHGKEAKINTEKAKRLLRDLQAQMSAVRAAYQLDALMDKRPCGSIALKNALSKAENCYTSASGALTSGLLSMSEFLLPRIQAARKRIDVEKVVESLNRATATYTTVNDLPKLISQILNARKVGAEELDPKGYHAARQLRGKLCNAAKIKQQLENGRRLLQKQQRESDVVALEEIIQRASDCWDLVEEDGIKAKEAITQWRQIQEAEERLREIIRCCKSSSELLTAIQEASSVGIRTQPAKKTLKSIQQLEITMKDIKIDVEQCKGLKSHLEEMEKGEIALGLTQIGRIILHGMLAVQAREVLEEVSVSKKDTSLKEYCTLLRDAIERSRSILELQNEKNDDENELGFWFTIDLDEMRKNQRSFLEAKAKVEKEIGHCEDEIQRQVEEEKEKKRKEIELENQRQQKLAEQKRRAEEEAERKAQAEKEKESLYLIAQDQQQLREIEMQDAQHKRICFIPKPSLDSMSTDEKESLAVLEHGIERLLEQDNPIPSTHLVHDPQSESNLKARDILEKLDNPWEVEEPPTPQIEIRSKDPVVSSPPSGFLLQSRRPSTILRPCNLQELFPSCHASLQQTASSEISRLFEKGSLGCENGGLPVSLRRMGTASLQPTTVTRPQNFVPTTITRCSEGLIGSSAFSTTSPHHVKLYPSLSPPGISSLKSPSWSIERGSSLSDQEFGTIVNPSLYPESSTGVVSPKECPFPGVGIGIPGTPNRSLSERMHRYFPLDLPCYSQSTDSIRFKFDSTTNNTKSFGQS